MQKNKINFFYTFNIPHNKIFVDLLIYTYPEYYKFQFISSVDEVNDGYILIPPLNIKSVNFESDGTVQNNKFFENLNKKKLLNSNSSSNIIDIFKLKTLSSSKYFVHESEVTSYLRFNANRIKNENFEKGYGWVLKKNI